MKAQDLKIKEYCRISNNRVLLNAQLLFEDLGGDFTTFIKMAYKKMDTNYPKFFKMDDLSKLGFLASDILLKPITQDSEKPKNIALVFSNSASSLKTDRKHQESIVDKENYFPSPAVFVYTLPNICLGEISIKHRLYSENSFFIFNHFNAGYLHDYASSLIKTEKADEVLCGWINCDVEDYEAFLYLVSTEGSIAHNKEEIIKLYTTK
ncbi:MULTISPECIES: 3-oxoacyl-ACP synthase [Arenibacter]|uniref:3-oxoacyl-ACP synthase n=1 Tax=Arenibacter TaxID=178469 RepID=UPI001C07B680|nr:MULTISPECIES: 3-oxoacyl-ACP synthase [Arenibacter]MBU2903733.1 3-oxoacyl-ACP synthase [Arenibacter algicola]MCK0134013.1 3-oxoacyl-ACP synthase [Arenibacter sp. S6351L]